jgi:hypothetical protein
MTARDAENLRSMRQMRDRSPVDAALHALACLDALNRAELVERFNRVFDKSLAIHITDLRKGEAQ